MSAIAATAGAAAVCGAAAALAEPRTRYVTCTVLLALLVAAVLAAWLALVSYLLGGAL